MFRFDTDDVLTGERPDDLPEKVWQIARDVVEENIHDSFVTFYVLECEADLSGGSPVSEPVCCGRSLAATISDAPYATERRETPGGPVWVAPINVCGYRADVLLLPEVHWLPDDFRQSLAEHTRRGEDRNA